MPAPGTEGSERQIRCAAQAYPPNDQQALVKQQPMASVASFPWIQTAQTSAVTAASPNQASLCILAGQGCLPLSEHADNSPAVGLVRTAGGGTALLGSPATPSWQGIPAGTAPTPLSSHPIDALEESDMASASSSTTDPASYSLPAHSDKRSGQLRSAESEAPLSPGLSNMGVPTNDGHLSIQDTIYAGSGCLHAKPQPLQVSWMPSQCLDRLSSSLDADAVVLEMESDVSVSADGLISPASSVASWQRDLTAHSPASSSHSSKLFPTLPNGTPSSLDRHRQHQRRLTSEGSILQSAYPPNSRADGTLGLYHASAPMCGLSPLPGPWHMPYQPHHHPHQQQQGSASDATSPLNTPWQQQQQPELPGVHDSAGQRSQQFTSVVTADYVTAAAQLRQAVAQAEQLYRASIRATDSAQQCGLGDSMYVAGQAGTMRFGTSGQEQAPVGGYSEQLPAALPDSRRIGVEHALRRAAEAAYPLQQPVWVPQGAHLCSCCEQVCLSCISSRSYTYM